MTNVDVICSMQTDTVIVRVLARPGMLNCVLVCRLLEKAEKHWRNYNLC
jgi:hypothetical protein